MTKYLGQCRAKPCHTCLDIETVYVGTSVCRILCINICHIFLQYLPYFYIVSHSLDEHLWGKKH